jgi:hypothetical protein
LSATLARCASEAGLTAVRRSGARRRSARRRSILPCRRSAFRLRSRPLRRMAVARGGRPRERTRASSKASARGSTGDHPNLRGSMCVPTGATMFARVPPCGKVPEASGAKAVGRGAVRTPRRGGGTSRPLGRREIGGGYWPPLGWIGASPSFGRAL